MVEKHEMFNFVFSYAIYAHMDQEHKKNVFGSFTVYTLVGQEYGGEPEMLGSILSYAVYVHAGQEQYKIFNGSIF